MHSPIASDCFQITSAFVRYRTNLLGQLEGLLVDDWWFGVRHGHHHGNAARQGRRGARGEVLLVSLTCVRLSHVLPLTVASLTRVSDERKPPHTRPHSLELSALQQNIFGMILN